MRTESGIYERTAEGERSMVLVFEEGGPFSPLSLSYRCNVAGCLSIGHYVAVQKFVHQCSKLSEESKANLRQSIDDVTTLLISYLPQEEAFSVTADSDDADRIIGDIEAAIKKIEKNSDLEEFIQSFFKMIMSETESNLEMSVSSEQIKKFIQDAIKTKYDNYPKLKLLLHATHASHSRRHILLPAELLPKSEWLAWLPSFTKRAVELDTNLDFMHACLLMQYRDQRLLGSASTPYLPMPAQPSDEIKNCLNTFQEYKAILPLEPQLRERLFNSREQLSVELIQAMREAAQHETKTLLTEGLDQTVAQIHGLAQKDLEHSYQYLRQTALKRFIRSDNPVQGDVDVFKKSDHPKQIDFSNRGVVDCLTGSDKLIILCNSEDLDSPYQELLRTTNLALTLQAERPQGEDILQIDNLSVIRTGEESGWQFLTPDRSAQYSSSLSVIILPRMFYSSLDEMTVLRRLAESITDYRNGRIRNWHHPSLIITEEAGQLQVQILKYLEGSMNIDGYDRVIFSAPEAPHLVDYFSITLSSSHPQSNHNDRSLTDSGQPLLDFQHEESLTLSNGPSTGIDQDRQSQQAQLGANWKASKEEDDDDQHKCSPIL